MPRQKKCRKVSYIPSNLVFLPGENQKDIEEVVISFVEVESIRLADVEGLDQTAAAEKMHISRGTYQRIINSGREKLADALINGKKIQIAGGNYQKVVDGEAVCCCKKAKRCETRLEGIKID